MTPTRKLLGAGAFSLALAGGGIAGAVLGTPSLTSAQDASVESETAPDDPGGRHHRHLGEGLEVAADALGMSVEDLTAELRDGKSIADVAEEQGVELETVTDALVEHGLARLAEAEAALPERVDEMVNRRGWGDDRPDRPGHHGAKLHGLETAAEAIGITPAELAEALRDGKTIAEVAADNGVDVDTVIDALVDEASARIDQAVQEGKLDEERATAMKEALAERITAFVNGEGPVGPPDGDGFRGPRGPRDAAGVSDAD